MISSWRADAGEDRASARGLPDCAVFGLLASDDGRFGCAVSVRLALLERTSDRPGLEGGPNLDAANPAYREAARTARQRLVARCWLGERARITWSVTDINGGPPPMRLKGPSMGLAIAMGLVKLWAGEGELGRSAALADGTAAEGPGAVLEWAAACSLARVAATGTLGETVGPGQPIKSVGRIEAKLLPLVESGEYRDRIDTVIVPAAQGMDGGPGDLDAPGLREYLPAGRAWTTSDAFTFTDQARKRRLLAIRAHSVAHAFETLARCQSASLRDL